MEYILRIQLANRDSKGQLNPSLAYADMLVESVDGYLVVPEDGSIVITKEELDQVVEMLEAEERAAKLILPEGAKK